MSGVAATEKIFDMRVPTQALANKFRAELATWMSHRSRTPEERAIKVLVEVFQ